MPRKRKVKVKDASKIKKGKVKSIYNVWVPKKRPAIEDKLFYHLTVLDKYSKNIPRKLPVALTLDFGTNVPTHSDDTRRFIPS